MNMLICCSGVQDIKQHSRPFWLAHTSVLLQILAFWSLWQVDVDLGKLNLDPEFNGQYIGTTPDSNRHCRRFNAEGRLAIGSLCWTGLASSSGSLGVVSGLFDVEDARIILDPEVLPRFGSQGNSSLQCFFCVGDFVVQVWRSNGSLTFCIGLHCFLIVWWWNNMKQLLLVVTRCFMLFHHQALTRSDSLGLLNLQSLEPDQDVICCADLLLDARSNECFERGLCSTSDLREV